MGILSHVRVLEENDGTFGSILCITRLNRHTVVNKRVVWKFGFVAKSNDLNYLSQSISNTQKFILIKGECYLNVLE